MKTLKIGLIAIVSLLFFPSLSPVCDEVPELNKKIHAFVKSSLGKKIGRGECWDLAAEALNNSEANWDGMFGFGREIDPRKDCVYPGDVIQFKNVKVKYQKGNTFYEEEMEQHTALVYEVKQKGSFVVAEQNTTRLGRKVGLNDLVLENITKGKASFFRPVKK